jgi:hypothetical protein
MGINHIQGTGLAKEKNDESIIQKCNRFREEANKFYSQFEDEKNEQERFYRGEHFVDKASENRAKNHIFQIIESEIPLLMDPMPATDIIAHDQENFGDHAVVLAAAKQHVYRQQNLTLKDVIAIRSALKTGSGFQYVDFDPDGEKGEGSITIKNLHRKQVRKDPAADTIDECRYVIIDSPLANDDLKRRYPKTADEAIGHKFKDVFVFNGRNGSSENRNTGSGGKNYANRYESKDMTFVEEYWVKDYTLEAIPNDETQVQVTEESAEMHNGKNPDVSKWEDHEAHIEAHQEGKGFILAELAAKLQIPVEALTEQDIENAKAADQNLALILNIHDDHIEMHQSYIEGMDGSELGKRPKYPDNLRLVVKTDDIIHYDGAPDIDDGLVPLVEFECYKDEGPAEGAIKHLVPLQKTINELDAKELRGLKRNANSGWIYDKESDVDPDTLTDDDGIVIPKIQGTEVTRIPPGQVSGQLENRSRRDYEAMNRIEGVGETIFGEAPKGDVSGVMYRRLQQQALGRIRLKSHMVGAAIYRRDLLILSRVMKKWSTERKLRSEDENGNIKFIKFDPSMMKDFTYELSMPEGSRVTEDRDTIQQTYKEMFMNGKIDLKTYALLGDLPKKTQLLKIMDEQDQVQAQMQQLTAQNQEQQKQMLMMKANLAPHLLSPDEAKLVQQLALQEQQEQITSNPMAVTSGDQAKGMPA